MSKLDTILLVDDDSDTNMIVSHIINKNQWANQVAVALNGEEAIIYLKTNPPPNLILLDINMPRVNGWEFLEEYKLLDAKIKQSVVIIMVTVSLNPEDRERAKKHNIEFFNKPLTAEMLKKIIETYCS